MYVRFGSEMPPMSGAARSAALPSAILRSRYVSGDDCDRDAMLSICRRTPASAPAAIRTSSTKTRRVTSASYNARCASDSTKCTPNSAAIFPRR